MSGATKSNVLWRCAWVGCLAVGLAGCTEPTGRGPGPMLVADPPPSDDGSVPGAELGDLDRGVALVKREAYAEALPYFDRVLEAKPDHAEAEYYRALARERTGDRAGAEKGYERVLSLNPKSVDAAVNLGALYLDDGGGQGPPARPDKAVAVLSKAVELAPNEADLHANLAYAYRLTKAYDKAAEQFDAALKLQDQAGVRFGYGDMLVEAGRCDQASSQLSKAIAGLGKDAPALGKVADLLGRCKAFDGCVQALDAAIGLEPAQPDLYVRRGACQHGLKKEQKARADFEKAIEKDPKFAPAHYYLGMSLRAEHMRTKAMAELQKAAELDPQGPIGAKAKKALEEMKKPGGH